MKKIYIFTILSLLFISAKAQDTLLSQDFPSAGDKFILSVGAAFTGMDVVATGPNYSWDFSNLTRTSQQYDTILAPINTDTLLSYYFINIGLNVNRANQATRAQNFALGLAGFSNVFNYYYNSSSNYKQVGFGGVVNGLPIPIAYTPHDVLYNFPLKYGDVDSLAYGYELDLTSTVGLYYNVKRHRHNEVDGWGAVLTPFGSFEVIRMVSILTETDSVYVDSLHLGVNIPVPTVKEYKWLSPGLGMPVLQINTNSANTVTQILYQDSAHLVSVHEMPVISNDLVVFPNPVTNNFIVHYSLVKNSDVNYELFSLDGRKIFSLNEKSIRAGEVFKSFDLKDYDLSPGNYLLKVKAGSSVITKQITKN